MPFVFILPVWAFCVVVGVALLFSRDLRKIGYFAIAVPTGATLVSFVLSTSVIYLVPRLAPEPHPQWFGIALIAEYVLALALGALIGAIGGFLLVLKVPAKKHA
jgi:hypothetical protein